MKLWCNPGDDTLTCGGSHHETDHYGWSRFVGAIAWHRLGSKSPGQHTIGGGPSNAVRLIPLRF
jgi:hypothetical protein